MLNQKDRITQTNMDIQSNLIEQKRKGMQVLGCYPLYPPVELFASMDLLPVVLWNLKASLSNLAESDKHIQNYACGIARELAQFVLSEPGTLLDGIFSYNACDTLRNLPEILAAANAEAGREIPQLQMHVPQIDRTQSTADRYLENEITALVSSTENLFHVEFSPEKFAQTTNAYAKMRALCLKAEELTAEGALPFGKFCRLVLSNYSLPVDDQIQNLSAFIAGAGGGKTSGTRNVFISGIMPPPAAIITAMDACRLRVVANDIAALMRSYAYSPPSTNDPKAFYKNLFANRFPCTTLLYRSDDRVETFLELVKRSGANGVIFSGEKFCEYEYFEFPYMEKRLKEKGIPSLLLEFSVDDAENINAYVTRLEAFAEMLPE